MTTDGVFQLAMGATFQCHGLGFAKAYIAPEVRCHVWHPMFQHNLWEESPHSHRWGMKSRIIHGALMDERIAFTECPDGATHELFTMGSEGDASVTSTGRVGVISCMQRTLTAGERYTMQRGEFHRSAASEGAVTLVHRFGVSGASSALAPIGRPPAHGSASSLPGDVVQRMALSILRAAADAMRTDKETTT